MDKQGSSSPVVEDAEEATGPADTAPEDYSVPSDNAEPRRPEDDPLYRQLDEAGAKLRSLLTEVSERSEQLETQLRQRVANAESAVTHEIEQAESTIRDNPFLAVGVSACLGVLVGLLVNRK